MMRTGFWAVTLMAGATACAPTRPPASLPPAAGAGADDERGAVAQAVHWTRSAAEHHAIFIQTYRAASRVLRESASGRDPGSWAVVLDADETVLDNSAFQLRLERSGAPYSEEIWNDWVREESASALPGAVEFTGLVSELGGLVAIVTNREAVVCAETRRNLAAVGVQADAVLCREDTGDKNPRFTALRSGEPTGTGPLDMVMWIGDNIGDFPGGSQAMRRGPASGWDRLGREWFVLPNPMYGSWESVPVREEEAGPTAGAPPVR